MKNFFKSKRNIIVSSVVAAILIILIVMFVRRGTISNAEWDSIHVGMSKESVTEYLGKPYKKTIDEAEIYDTYSFVLMTTTIGGDVESTMSNMLGENSIDDFFAIDSMLDSGESVEMYEYQKDQFIYFIDDKVFAKL